jgi:nucleoside-diphosphate-sugar epimerase
MEADLARVLVIGGTGFLGGLLSAMLLSRTRDHVVIATRPGHERDEIVARLRMEMTAEGDVAGEALDRLSIVQLPAPGDSRGFSSLFRENRIDEVLNSAGAVHYFDVEKLKASNIDLVNDLIAASREVRIRRFVHISTAFAQGYSDETAKEALFPEPTSDPTEYTRYKRYAERLVAESGLPFLILRPSIVIGDSRDGHYFGAEYGLYQFWSSFAKMLMDRYRETLHGVATRGPLPLLHQDAFAETYLAAREQLTEDSFVNVVSAPDELPSVRDLWRLWCDNVARPHKVLYYDAINDAPMRALDPRYRAWLYFTSVNQEISNHNWRFETTNRDRLIRDGLNFRHVTLDTVRKCQNRFVSSSETVRSYNEKFEKLFPGAPVAPRNRPLAESAVAGRAYAETLAG